MFLPILLLCVHTKVWETTAYHEFIRGEPKKISIHREGTLSLAPELTFLSQIPEPYIFSLIEDKKGNVYCGTGNQGKIYKIDKKGKASLFFDTRQVMVLTLLLDSNDYLYCGTTPQGYIYKISPSGKGKIFFKTPEKYVWGLAFDEKGYLYAATGVEGKIYKISPQGKGEIIYTASDPHIMSLVYKNAVFFGTAGSGRVYKIYKKDAIALYEPEEAEVHSLLIDEENNLYLGCNPKSTEANPAIYKIDSSGIVKWSYSLPDSLILSMTMDDRYGVIVGTGSKGKVYSFSKEGEGSLLIMLEEPQILSICKGKRLILGAGSPCKVYSLSKNYAEKGEYISDVLDAGTIARWGKIEPEAEIPKATEISIFTRSGNSKKPDDTWSNWEKVNDGKIISPQARFIQWKVSLSTYNPAKTPLIKSVKVWYLPTNLPPEITQINISHKDARKEISWDSWDPNDDALLANIYFKGVEEENWKILKEGIKDTMYYSFDASALPDGKYTIKIIVTDKMDNPKELALTAKKISDPFTIDNTPPKVTKIRTEKKGKGKYRIEFSAEDKLSIISTAFYSLNAGDWHPIAPKDLIFDSRSEEFSFEIEVEPGEWVVMVKVEDNQKNIGTNKAIISER